VAELSEAFAALLARAREGDSAAAAELVGRYESRVRLVARVLLGTALQPHLDSMDLVQSVHRSLLLGVRQGKFAVSTPEELVALATTMVRRKVARKWRHLRRQRRLESGPADVGPLPELLLSLHSTDPDPPLATVATAISGRPSPLESATAIDPGKVPTAKVCWAVNEGSVAPAGVVFSKTDTAPADAPSATTRSGRPSRLRSATATEEGLVPTGRAIWPVKDAVAAPTGVAFSITVTKLLRAAVTARSGRPSPLKSPTATEAGLLPVPKVCWFAKVTDGVRRSSSVSRLGRTARRLGDRGRRGSLRVRVRVRYRAINMGHCLSCERRVDRPTPDTASEPIDPAGG
jgi:DNA-directed RNA polymerase specialized sigma24 family protein